MKTIRLAISCAGSGIGQSIVDSCKLSNLPLLTYGFDCNPKAYGIYDCDFQVITPRIDEPGYIDDIIAICIEKTIDVFIPGTDHDVHLVSKHISRFNRAGIEVIVSEPGFIDLVRDKERASIELNTIVPIFVKSYNRDNIEHALREDEVRFPLIAKPLSGSGSVGVNVLLDKSDLEKLKADDVVQELAIPHKKDFNLEYFHSQINQRINPQVSELSIHCVTNRDGDIIGRMITHNKLKNGVPIEIIPYENPMIWKTLQPLLDDFIKRGWRGPLNIQGRLTDDGLRLFEMNARFTGISGLRAHFGFNEVDACIRSWLGMDDTVRELSYNKNLFGLRQTANKVVHFDRSKRVKVLSEKINGGGSQNSGILLLTGSTGYLGLNLIEALLTDHPDDFEIWALTRNKNIAEMLLPSEVRIFDVSDLEHSRLAIGNVDILIHAGFSRALISEREIARSLDFTSKLFRRAAEHQVPYIINVSSEAIYEGSDTFQKDESSEVSPDTVYGFAKYSAELMLRDLCRQNSQVRYTSLRLSGLTGGAKGLVHRDLLSEFVKCVKAGKDLKLDGSIQEFDRLDIRDAVSALIAMITSDNKNWDEVYNLGNPDFVGCRELAEVVLDISRSYLPDTGSKILIKNDETDRKYGMDTSRFIDHTGWKPEYSLKDTIHSLFQFEY